MMGAMRALWCALLVVLCVPAASAQYETVRLSDALTARSLEGIVTDRNGAPVVGATVQLCTTDWKSCGTQSDAVTNADGKFAVAAKEHNKLYYLRIMRDTFDPLEFKVHLSRYSSKQLRVSMTVAS
jgi:hypothetical protein